MIPVSKEKWLDKAANEIEPNELKAFFEISYKIAKAGKNRIIAYTFIKPVIPSNCFDHA
jgi:hypothetical protein